MSRAATAPERTRRAKREAALRRSDVDKPPEAKATWWPCCSSAEEYWRCTIPARRLPGKVTATETVQSRAEAIFAEQERAAAIWELPTTIESAAAAKGMRVAGIPVLIDIDDDHFAKPPLPRQALADRKDSRRDIKKHWKRSATYLHGAIP